MALLRPPLDSGLDRRTRLTRADIDTARCVVAPRRARGRSHWAKCTLLVILHS